MKSSKALSFVMLCCCLLAFTEAAPENRHKRSVSLERCPPNSTAKQCKEYAEEQSKKLDYCHRYLISGHIEWQSCGVTLCAGNSRLVDEDLSKPYPDCCQTCEVIDPSKPASISGVA